MLFLWRNQSWFNLSYKLLDNFKICFSEWFLHKYTGIPFFSGFFFFPLSSCRYLLSLIYLFSALLVISLYESVSKSMKLFCLVSPVLVVFPYDLPYLWSPGYQAIFHLYPPSCKTDMKLSSYRHHFPVWRNLLFKNWTLLTEEISVTFLELHYLNSEYMGLNWWYWIKRGSGFFNSNCSVLRTSFKNNVLNVQIIRIHIKSKK